MEEGKESDPSRLNHPNFLPPVLNTLLSSPLLIMPLPYASPTEQEDSAEEEEQTVSLKDLILARNYTYWRKDNRSHMQCILSYSCQNLMDKNQAFFHVQKPFHSEIYHIIGVNSAAVTNISDSYRDIVPRDGYRDPVFNRSRG